MNEIQPRSLPEPEETEWECGWEEHEIAQLRRTARWSLSDKLDWLEGAQEIANHLQKSREAMLAQRKHAGQIPDSPAPLEQTS